MTKPSLSRIEQKEQTRSGLILAATRLFADKGIAHTATADIARAQKVSHGTVFVHFPTRDDLILAVIDEFGEKLSREFGDCLKDSDLESLIAYHLDVLAEYEDFYYRLITEQAYLPPKVKSLVFMLNAAVSWKLYEAAKPRMEKQELKRLSRSHLFNSWIALVQYYVMNRELLAESTPILKKKKRELVDHFMQLISTTHKER